MTTRSWRHPSLGGAAPAGKRLTYEDIRDRFLAELPRTAEEELQYFARIGMFVFFRWQAIADDHPPGTPIDESAHDARWDECTDRDFDGIGDGARALIEAEVGRQRVAAFVGAWARTVEPMRVVTRGLSWFAMRMWEHFVGAFGLLAFGLLLVLVAPHVAKAIRSTLDETMPAETRPDADAGNRPTATPPPNASVHASPS